MKQEVYNSKYFTVWVEQEKKLVEYLFNSKTESTQNITLLTE